MRKREIILFIVNHHDVAKLKGDLSVNLSLILRGTIDDGFAPVPVHYLNNNQPFFTPC